MISPTKREVTLEKKASSNSDSGYSLESVERLRRGVSVVAERMVLMVSRRVVSR